MALSQFLLGWKSLSVVLRLILRCGNVLLSTCFPLSSRAHCLDGIRVILGWSQCYHCLLIALYSPSAVSILDVWSANIVERAQHSTEPKQFFLPLSIRTALLCSSVVAYSASLPRLNRLPLVCRWWTHALFTSKPSSVKWCLKVVFALVLGHGLRSEGQQFAIKGSIFFMRWTVQLTERASIVHILRSPLLNISKDLRTCKASLPQIAGNFTVDWGLTQQKHENDHNIALSPAVT